MQVTIDINDELYQSFIRNGINVREVLMDYISRFKPEDAHKWAENKTYFQNVLQEIERGEAVLLEHDEVWERIDRQTQ